MSLFKKLNTSEQNSDPYAPATSANSATFQSRVAKVAGLAASPNSQNQILDDQKSIYWAMHDAISRIAESINDSVYKSKSYSDLVSAANKINTSSLAGIRQWETTWIEGVNQIKRGLK